MSNFKAKYHTLHLLQKLAGGESSQNRGGRGTASASPRKPGIRTSDDILREKYTELAELMAVQHLEQRAVSALQKMYLSPKRSERKPRRRRRRMDDNRGRSQRGRDDVDREIKPRPPTTKKPSRPESASSSSSHSSYNSAKSTSSGSSNFSNASRLSSASATSRESSRSSTSSNASRTSSRSNSSRSSTRSKSSASVKPVERHIVTIVEEEEEEEVVNQDEIEARELVPFDEELAKENEEEARRKKEASKRTRHVSFVLEAREESSSEDEEKEEENASSDDTLKGAEHVEKGEEDNSPRDHQSDASSDDGREDKEYEYVDKKDRQENVMNGQSISRSKYIEIEDSILREILSPRSPRRMPKHSPRSAGYSPTRRSRSKSPGRRRCNTSPERAWEASSSLPLPPRPKRDVSPCDHKLSNTDNPDVRRWLRHKNALIRRQRKEEKKKEREKQLAVEALAKQKQDKHEESELFYYSWLHEKEKILRKQHKMDKLAVKEEKKREEEERAKREELLQEKRRAAASAFGEKLPTPRPEKKRRRKRKPKKDESGINGNTKSDEDGAGKKTFPSSNPFKGLTYDQWMRQKLDQEQARKKETKAKKVRDPELEEVIPNIAKERINRAAGGKGKRVDSGLRPQKDGNDMPECDQATKNKKQSVPYTWQQENVKTHSPSLPKSGHGKQASGPKKVGLQRPSTSQNRLSRHHDEGMNAHPRPQSGRKPHVFSPSFARPEPQGSESNDDHSERSAKLENIDKNTPSESLNKQKPASADRNNNSNHEDGLVLKMGDQNSIVLDPNELSVFMTEAIP